MIGIRSDENRKIRRFALLYKKVTTSKKQNIMTMNGKNLVENAAPQNNIDR